MKQEGKNNLPIFLGTDSGKQLLAHGASFLQFVRRQLLDGQLMKDACACQVRTPAYTCLFSVRKQDTSFCQLVIQDTSTKEELLRIQQVALDKVLINHELFVDTRAPYIAVLASLLTEMNDIQDIRGAYEMERTHLFRSWSGEPKRNSHAVQVAQLKSLFQANRRSFTKTSYATIVHILKVTEDTVEQTNESSLLPIVQKDVNCLMHFLANTQISLHQHIAIQTREKQLKSEDNLLIKLQTVFTQALDIQEKLMRKK